MDLDTTRYLLSPDGEELLRVAASLDGSFLTRVTTLRKRYPAAVASAALELLELRERAKRKFSLADRMFFTREALEQSSSEVVSRYRAGRFAQNSTVLDLGCGIGGDTIGLAERCAVTSVDMDPVRLAMAERNLQVYGLSDRVRFVLADITDMPLHADAAFIDPARRSGGRRTTSLCEMIPPVSFLYRLVEAIPDTAVKLSPASDDSELESLGGEIEFISADGECKEAVVWFGALRTVAKRATVLPEALSLVDAQTVHIEVTPPSAYLYEPDPCVIRGHLIDVLAAAIGATKLDPQIAYLTGPDLVFTPFATSYRVLDSLPFNLKAVNQRLRELDAGRVVVKKRGVPFEPDDIRRKLKLSGSLELTLVLTRVSGRPSATICVPTRSGGNAPDHGE